MRVLWPHNFDPKTINSGNFMYLLAAGLRELGINIELFYLGNLRSFKNIFRKRLLLKRIATEFDLVHSQFGSACAFVSSVVKNRPIILSLRGSDWYRYKERLNFNFIHGFIANFLTRLSLRKFESVIVMSYRMKDEIQSLFPELEIFVIPSPIDLRHFQPFDKANARALLGYTNDTDRWVLFTTLSHDNPIKRIKLTKKAVELANERIDNVKIRIASGICHADMPLFVNSCDLIINTSTHEGWPNSIKEALACNVPFVSTDVSDLNIVSNDDNSCRICPPDPDILANNICEVLNLPLSNRNLRRFVTHMDVDITSRKLVDIYKYTLEAWQS